MARRGAVESETDFQSFVTDAAERLGWEWFHDTDPRRDRPNMPDLVLVNEAAGRFIVAELKTEDGQLTEGQARWLRAADRAGVEWYLWRPADREKILRILDWQHRGIRLS